jgi:hypothetical protein
MKAMSDSITRTIEVVRIDGKLFDPNDTGSFPEGFDGKPEEIEVQITFDFERADGDGWNEPRTPAHCTVASVLDIETGNLVPDKIIDLHVEQWEEEALEYTADKLFPDPDEDDRASCARVAGKVRRYRKMFA